MYNKDNVTQKILSRVGNKVSVRIAGYKDVSLSYYIMMNHLKATRNAEIRVNEANKNKTKKEEKSNLPLLRLQDELSNIKNTEAEFDKRAETAETTEKGKESYFPPLH